MAYIGSHRPVSGSAFQPSLMSMPGANAGQSSIQLWNRKSTHLGASPEHYWLAVFALFMAVESFVGQTT